MLGRLLGGVSTSLLFSIFEAWLIRAHADHGIKSYLGKSFGWAAYGNSVIAIIAGLVANKAASIADMFPIVGDSMFAGGYLSPFDIALCALLVCAGLALTTWEENYGESSSSQEKDFKWYDGLKNAFTTTIRSQDILLCGLISSLFEGSMYSKSVSVIMIQRTNAAPSVPLTVPGISSPPKSLSSFGHLPSTMHPGSIYHLVSYFLPSWCAAWRARRCLAFRLNSGKENSWRSRSLVLLPLPWHSFLSVAATRSNLLP
jgi:hypothetical protein